LERIIYYDVISGALNWKIMQVVENLRLMMITKNNQIEDG